MPIFWDMAQYDASCTNCGTAASITLDDNHPGNSWAWECANCGQKHDVPATASLQEIYAAAGNPLPPPSAEATQVADTEVGVAAPEQTG